MHVVNCKATTKHRWLRFPDFLEATGRLAEMKVSPNITSVSLAEKLGTLWSTYLRPFIFGDDRLQVA